MYCDSNVGSKQFETNPLPISLAETRSAQQSYRAVKFATYHHTTTTYVRKMIEE
jgi:hypothetical protein